MTTEQLLTAKEVAKLLRIGYSSVFRLVATGKLASVRIGHCVRFRVEDVKNLIAESMQTTPG